MLPLTPDSLSQPDAVRFLQRATFGVRPGDDTDLINRGVDAWFTDQFRQRSSPTVFDLRERKDVPAGRAYWEHILSGDAQLRKRVAYALSQIFVASDSDLDRREVMAHASLLEDHAFGSYRELLEAVTRSLAMGKYLTYLRNWKADPRKGTVPDENYAREIMQLFSIGLWRLNLDGTQRLGGDGEPIPTYDNDDIIGLARVFTGWVEARDRHPQSPMVQRADRHERGEKRFLGTTIPAETDGEESLRIALDTIANHRNVAPFIGRQLIQRLVTSNPTRGYIRRVSRVFEDDGNGQRGNLAAVVRAILTDDEAWQRNPPEFFGKLREPVLRLTVLMRALDIGPGEDDFWQFNDLDEASAELGQEPFQSPSVFNFYRPGYVPPQSEIGAAGYVAPEFQIANEPSVIGWINYIARVIRFPGSRTYPVNIEDWSSLADDVPALVTAVAERLCPSGLSSGFREIIERSVRQIEDRMLSRQVHERVMGTVLMIAASTDFLYER